mgnify:CR=1 FL=1|jgi:hypothetical protein|tara:strand:+ start:896 stop:1126 length:231 start_codon:yes stop_codon:yes gene_type:complete
MYALEHFAINQMSGGAKTSPLQIFIVLVTVIAFQLLFIWFAKFLWNNYLVQSVSVVKPVKDLWQMLAIFVLIKLLF